MGDGWITKLSPILLPSKDPESGLVHRHLASWNILGCKHPDAARDGMQWGGVEDLLVIPPDVACVVYSTRCIPT